MSKFRIINFFTTVIFIFFFRELYEGCLVNTYGFYGYRISNNDSWSVLLTNILCFLPIFFYRGRERVSDLLAIFTYVMIYVPTLIGLQYHYSNYMFSLQYQLSLYVGMLLFFRASSSPISNQVLIKGRVKSINWRSFLTIGIIIFLLVLFIYRGNLHLVSFDDVYGLRSDNAGMMSSIPFGQHIYMWMGYAISPLFIAIGCDKQKKTILFMGFLMSLIYYMSSGMKISAFIPFMAYLFYKGLSNNSKRNIVYIYPILVFGVILAYIIYKYFYSEATAMIVAILVMRSYGISPLLAVSYIDVFQKYPYTYYSHIGIIGKITGLYPFGDMSLGHAISWYSDGPEPESQANANFMVSDGIAAGGIVGVLIISVLFYFLICYLNKWTNGYRYCFVASSMAGILMCFTNGSIFTTIMSAGLIILIVFYCFSNYFKSYKNENMSCN